MTITKIITKTEAKQRFRDYHIYDETVECASILGDKCDCGLGELIDQLYSDIIKSIKDEIEVAKQKTNTGIKPKCVVCGIKSPCKCTGDFEYDMKQQNQLNSLLK